MLSIAPRREQIELEADAIRLEQVLVNLLTNSSRYTEAGGKIGLDAAWTRAMRSSSACRTRALESHSEMLDRIFDPFVPGSSRGGFVGGRNGPWPGNRQKVCRAARWNRDGLERWPRPGRPSFRRPAAEINRSLKS